MKTAIFNKKRIVIAVSILFILTIIISLCSFEFRQPSGNGTMIPAGQFISNNAAHNFVSIIEYQTNIGQLRASKYVLVFWQPNYGVYSILVPEGTTCTISYFDNNLVSFSFSNTVYQYIYQEGYGFVFQANISSYSNKVNLNYLYYSDYSISNDNFSIDGFNSNANFGSNDLDTADVYNYYNYIYSSCVERDQRESELVSNAFAEGESVGYGNGWDLGYNNGYDIGYDYGHDRGYSEGQTEGYSEGYSEGFDFGVENGYRLGFDEGEEEGYSEGYSEGESNGYSSGHQVGFDEGREEGYTLGFDNGYSEGYTEGYSEGYETGYNIVYDDLQQPGTIEAIFTTKDSSGNTLYLAQEADIENLAINYAFLPKDQLSDSYDGYRLFVKTYDVTKYLEQHPLDFDYPLPVIEYQNTDFLALYRKVNVTRQYFDLYRVYSYVEVKIDQSFINQLNNQYNEGLNDANALVNGIGDIATKPITSLKDALNFEIFGLNIGVVAVGIVAILFAIWAYNKIRKVLPI